MYVVGFSLCAVCYGLIYILVEEPKAKLFVEIQLLEEIACFMLM